MNQTIPTKPENLDPTRLHSPDEVRQWKGAWEDYHAAIRAIEQAKITKAQAIVAYENRTLTESEYFDMKVKQKAENDARQAERAAAEKTKELAKIDFLMSSPPVVEILETNEHKFMLSVINFASRGYELPDDGIIYFGMGCYSVKLTAPAKTKGSK